MIITKISKAVKTEGRYNVFLDEEFAFSLDEDQLVRLKLRKGQELSETEVEELKAESDFGKNYIRALDLISRRLRSEREIRDYGFRKRWSKDNLEKVIARLYQRGYLDDSKFAAAFVRSRAATRTNSKRQIQLALAQKGIKPEIIAEVIANSEEYSEAAALSKLIDKKFHHYDDEKKLIAYLARQGFSYDDIRAGLEQRKNNQQGATQ
jgi:regulatory protein